MKSTINSALSEVNELKHIFLSTYNKNSKILYFIAEGEEDKVYYSNFIQAFLPDETWEYVFITPSNKVKNISNKEKVLSCIKELDWRIFNKNQIVFFVDRDLSDFQLKKQKEYANLYITDGYSIENSIVNTNTFVRTITENCYFKNCSIEQKDKLKVIFKEAFFIFYEKMSNIMGWILYWHEHQLRPSSLDDIKIKNLFDFSDINIKCNINANDKNIHECVSIDYNNKLSIKKYIDKFRKIDKSKNFVRGKYVFDFFVELCRCLNKNYKTISGLSLEKINKKDPCLSFIDIAHIAKMPMSLSIFFDHTIKKYINEF